jgi:hypothetical protein
MFLLLATPSVDALQYVKWIRLLIVMSYDDNNQVAA